MDADFLLIHKMKSGDEDAMEIFVRKYYGDILRYCRYHTVSREQAEDFTQETFAKFFKAIAGYMHKGKALNYLYVIARNLCIDGGRAETESAMSKQAETKEDRWTEIDAKMDMERALQKLPHEMREVVVLYYFQELTLRETAEVLGIGLPLAKYRMKRAKEQLQKYFRHD